MASLNYNSAVLFTDIPTSILTKIKSFQEMIPENILKKEYTKWSIVSGVETFPHISVITSCVQSSLQKELKTILSKGSADVHIKSGNLIYFDKPEKTAACIQVHSEELSTLHMLFKASVLNAYKFPEYSPHLTIAYLQPGERLPFGIEPFEWVGTKTTVSCLHDEDSIELGSLFHTNKISLLEEMLKTEFFLTNFPSICEKVSSLFDLISFEKLDSLAKYVLDSKKIVFDYTSFHDYLANDIMKIKKVLVHELTHMRQHMENKLVVPEEDTIDNYFTPGCEYDALENEIRYLKIIGFSSKEISYIFSDSFSRFGEAFTFEHADKLKIRIESII